MPGFDQLAAFVVAVAVLIVVPGPSVLFVVSRGVVLGRRAAVSTAVGNEAGLLIQAVAVAVGLGSIVERSVVVFSVIKFAGALYLGCLGVQAWRHRKELSVPKENARSDPRTWKVLREGFIVGISNPKGFLIFAAVLPQFVNPEAGSIPLQMLLLGFVCVAIALITDASWGLLAGTARDWFEKSPRRMSAIGGTSGVVMVGLGIQLAFSNRH
ncbi:threonine/homoserine/homoserine lactone efflux protein [Lipingzhangella halophila]|uniref:Threonine/homoserine/homoserine lactone efflux protein n=1 Tax=Lipingzhangella halophila TaxID=1783352 RepID=A0A7W7RIM0_9ACTN|nr:LysE family translocator [Lipingzhangella halophila]MBB4932674.1 threonine/homoserine/homoserine lactone efflux protein [Lipingzhangella halophila]